MSRHWGKLLSREQTSLNVFHSPDPSLCSHCYSEQPPSSLDPMIVHFHLGTLAFVLGVLLPCDIRPYFSMS